MDNLVQSISIEYVVSEDRLRFIAELSNGDVSTLWMTQRLLNRLIAKLMLRLPLDKFEAGTGLSPSNAEPRSVLATEATRSVLVQSVDVIFGTLGVKLTFQNGEGYRAILPLSDRTLREWLQILLRQYRRADWAQDVWPEWFQKLLPANASRHSLTLH